MEYANSFDDLRGDIIATFESVSKLGEAQQRFNDAMTTEVERLWKDNAELRDEINAVANRLEALTNYVTTAPAEVAERMIDRG